LTSPSWARLRSSAWIRSRPRSRAAAADALDLSLTLICGSLPIRL